MHCRTLALTAFLAVLGCSDATSPDQSTPPVAPGTFEFTATHNGVSRRWAGTSAEWSNGGAMFSVLLTSADTLVGAPRPVTLTIYGNDAPMYGGRFLAGTYPIAAGTAGVQYPFEAALAQPPFVAPADSGHLRVFAVPGGTPFDTLLVARIEIWAHDSADVGSIFHLIGSFSARYRGY